MLNIGSIYMSHDNIFAFLVIKQKQDGQFVGYWLRKESYEKNNHSSFLISDRDRSYVTKQWRQLC
jgi:hypothetical protein